MEKFKNIQVSCDLTERQYRRYMRFHVLGDKKDVIMHLVLAGLFVVFGLMNFHTGSPILGAIFITMGGYFFLSRYLRFYISVNRIIGQFGLSDTPKRFYEISFLDDCFDVRNAKEQARYPFSRIHRACFMEKDQIVYLYLTPSSAFLLPYGGFTQGTPQALQARLNAADVAVQNY